MPKIILEDCNNREVFLKKINLNKSIKIFINYLLGPILFIWLSYTVFHQIHNQPDFSLHLKYIKEAAYGKYAIKFWMVIVMMFFNWGIEALKWKTLMLPLEELSFFKSLKATFSGVAFALNTPNRIGEYGGRILYIKEGNRIKAVTLTLVGSFSQLIVTILFGTVGLFIMNDLFVSIPLITSFKWSIHLFQVVLVVIVLILFVIYFNTSWIIKKVETIGLFKRWIKFFVLLEEVSLNILLKVIVLSALRFLVFGIQYNLLLEVMHVEIDWFVGFWLVSILFLMLAIMPSIALLELGLRWQYNLFLFGLFSANAIGIYAVATGIWLINLVLPAIIGTILMLGVKVFKET
jgi:hypothetical protein